MNVKRKVFFTEQRSFRGVYYLFYNNNKCISYKLYKINNLTIGKENWELRAKGLVYTCYKIIPVTFISNILCGTFDAYLFKYLHSYRKGDYLETFSSSCFLVASVVFRRNILQWEMILEKSNRYKTKCLEICILNDYWKYIAIFQQEPYHILEKNGSFLNSMHIYLWPINNTLLLCSLLSVSCKFYIVVVFYFCVIVQITHAIWNNVS